MWRYEDGKVSKIPVTLGAVNNEAKVEIQGSMLSGGDIIVTAGVYFLHDGQHVRLSEE